MPVASWDELTLCALSSLQDHRLAVPIKIKQRAKAKIAARLGKESGGDGSLRTHGHSKGFVVSRPLVLSSSGEKRRFVILWFKK